MIIIISPVDHRADYEKITKLQICNNGNQKKIGKGDLAVDAKVISIN